MCIRPRTVARAASRAGDEDDARWWDHDLSTMAISEPPAKEHTQPARGRLLWGLPTLATLRCALWQSGWMALLETEKGPQSKQRRPPPLSRRRAETLAGEGHRPKRLWDAAPEPCRLRGVARRPKLAPSYVAEHCLQWVGDSLGADRVRPKSDQALARASPPLGEHLVLDSVGLVPSSDTGPTSEGECLRRVRLPERLRPHLARRWLDVARVRANWGRFGGCCGPTWAKARGPSAPQRGPRRKRRSPPAQLPPPLPGRHAEGPKQ